MTRIELMKAAIKFVEDHSATCGNPDTDQEHAVSDLWKLLRDTYEAGLRTHSASPKEAK